MDGSARTPSLDELLGQERWLQALARRLVRDAATAEDLVQETWFRALRAERGREREGGSVGDARAWLARVLRNVWREKGRSERARGRRERSVAPSETLPSARESLERIELQQRLAALVLELDEPYRSIVIWRYYEGRTAADVAADLGEPAERVRWRLMRARELLRRRLERDRADWAAHYALFLPLARRAPPPAAVAAGAEAAARFGALTMIGTSLLWGSAATLVVWTLVRFEDGDGRSSDSGTPERTLASAEPEPEPTLVAAPAASAPRSAVAPESGAPGSDADEEAAQASTSARLRGSVRAAEDGRALADVEVGLFDPDGGSLKGSARSDAEGEFLLEGEPGAYQVACRLAGRVPRRVRAIELVAGSETAIEVELERGFPVVVEVVERVGGAPVAAADVQLFAGDYDTLVWLRPDDLRFRSLAGTTSADGRVELGGAARGTYQYLVKSAGHASALGQALLEADAAPLRVVLDRGGVVFGTVLRPDGTPAEGARVFLNPIGYVKGRDERVFRQNGLAADSAGRYRLEGVPEGVYYGVALLPDGSGSFHFEPDEAPERELARILVADSIEVPVDFRLPAPGRVRGRVLDSAGQPIAGARVNVSWGDFKPGRADFFAISSVPGMKESIHHSTRTDHEGRFQIETLRSSYEPLEFRVDAKGFVDSEVELDVAPGALLEPVITLHRLGARITGRLTHADGTPAAGQTVGCFEQEGSELAEFFQAQTAADGTYELSVALEPASGKPHRIQPILRDSSPFFCEPELREGVMTGASGVDFVLRAKHRLHGTVVDDGGSPVRDFLVHALERKPGSEDRWEQRDVDRGEGRFDLFLDSALIVQLRFSAPGCDPCSLTDLDGGDERRIVLRRAGDLEGVVRDRQGRGAAGAVVALATLDSAIYPKGTEFAPRDTTDAEGRFRLRGVPDLSAAGGAPPPGGRGHLLVCPRRDDAPALVHFPMPEQRGAPLELVLPRALTVELEFVHANGSPVEGGVIVVDPEGWPMEPAFETHLLDQQSSTRGALDQGRTRFCLRPGAHRVVLVRGLEATNEFPFEVVDGDDTAVQQRSFTVPAAR